MKNLKRMTIFAFVAMCIPLSAFAETSVMPERMQVPPMNLTVGPHAQTQRESIIQRLRKAQQENESLSKMPPYKRAEVMHKRAEMQREKRDTQEKTLQHRTSTDQMYRNYMQSGSIKYGPNHSPQIRRIPLQKNETMMQGIQNEARIFSGLNRGESLQ